MNDTNTSLMSSISTNNFLRDCIELAIDGFLFRGVTPSDHYYRFSQSFPKAFTLLTSYSNPNVSSIMMTPKQSHHHQISSSSKHSGTQHQRTNNVPPLDLSSLNPNILLEQQPVSTIIPPNNPGMTIQVKKPVYSPKGSLSSSSTSDHPHLGSRHQGSLGTKTPFPSLNTPCSSDGQSPSVRNANSKRSATAPSPSTNNLNSPQQELNPLETEARQIQERMGKYRSRHGRPNDLSLMHPKQIYDEKCDMQQELLRFENKYSKPTTSEEKRIMKPLYDYYRQLKRLVEKQQQI